MPYLAGVELDDEEMQGLALTVAMPNMPIIDSATLASELPADDLPGFIARALGLDPAAVTARQRAEITAFITDHTL